MSGLAVAGWATPGGLRLDLRYAPEEADWLDPRPASLWEDVVAGLPALGAGAAEHYAVDDPYGGERGAAGVRSAFGVVVGPGQVTFGAGITSLLHGLSALTDGRTLVTPALSHPDLGVWARARGASVWPVKGPLSVGAVIAAADAAGPAVVQIDRPTFRGEVATGRELELLAARTDGVVIVDEAGANYLTSRESAIDLVPELPNLVVLRGFTKAYSFGGIRVGLAVASREVAHEVRAVLAPLQVSELSLHVALRLLATGDPCARLRERIRAVRPEIADVLRAADMRVWAGHPDVPAIVVDDAAGVASRELDRRGIRGLSPPTADAGIVQLRIPIADERIQLLRALLS